MSLYNNVFSEMTRIRPTGAVDPIRLRALSKLSNAFSIQFQSPENLSDMNDLSTTNFTVVASSSGIDESYGVVHSC